MLNFDANRFLRIETGALALATSIQAVIGECLDKGARNIFFIGNSFEVECATIAS